MITLEYAKLSTIDTPAQGMLAQARMLKKDSWKRVKALRERLKSMGLFSGNTRLELLIAESAHRDILAMERDALSAIESRANELGLTTKRESATQNTKED